MKKLAEGIFQLDLLQANVFILQGRAGLILIDAAVQGILPKLERQLRQLSFRVQDIKHILITHAHMDHVGGLREIQQASGADVWTHSLEAPIVRGEKAPVMPPLEQLSWTDRVLGQSIRQFINSSQQAAPVHHELQDGDTLHDLFKGLEILHLPGHSAGQSGFWLPRQNLLIGGDVMMHLSPWLTRPLAAYTPDMTQADASILKVATLDIHTLAVGHGPALQGNARAAIQKLARKIDRQQAQPLAKTHNL